MSQWYQQTGLGDQGPVSFDELRSRARDGRLHEEDLVRRVGEEAWQKAYRVVGLFTAPSAAKESSTAPAARAKHPPVGRAGEAQPLRWWQLPLDRVEMVLMGLLLAWLAAVAAYLLWSSQPPTFPPPKHARPQRTTTAEAQAGWGQSAQRAPAHQYPRHVSLVGLRSHSRAGPTLRIGAT